MKRPVGQNQKLKTNPPPIGGLNARDSAFNMPMGDAVRLINWLPDSLGVRCRKGWREWGINFPGNAAVKSVLPYFSSTATFPGGQYLIAPTTMPGKLFAATDTAIYDLTSTTNAPAVARTLSGATNAGWISHTMLANSGGSFMLLASEADGYYTYDGTTWLKRVMGGGAGEVSGVDPATFVHVNLFKHRAWFVQRDTTKAWYLPTDSISGAATVFDFGPNFKKGGHLAFTANWTIDAGEGIDDFLVAVSSNGEVTVYQGTDPSSASTFALVGTWYVGQIPVGRRCYSQYGGDLLLISTDGVVPISMVTRGGSQLLMASNKDYSSKISILVGQALRRTFTSYGWQLQLSSSERTLLCGYPNYPGHADEQFALSTVVNQWGLLRGIPALCFGAIGGYTFSGTSDGRLLLLFQDYSDAVPYGDDVGDPIIGEVVPAFDVFDFPANQKQVVMISPGFISPFQPGIEIDVLMDYADATYQVSPDNAQFRASAWDVALWSQGIWGATTRSAWQEWYSVNAEPGAAAAARMTTACAGDTILTNFKYMYLVGGPL